MHRFVALYYGYDITQLESVAELARLSPILAVSCEGLKPDGREYEYLQVITQLYKLANSMPIHSSVMQDLD